MSTVVNLNGIDQLTLNFDGTTTAALTAPGEVTITHSGATSGITQLTGDVTAGPGSGSVAATVVGVNGAAVPATHAYVGTNSSGQIISATTPLLPANNLSDVSSASTARSNLGLGTMATQNSSSVDVTGGTIDGTAIGATTPATSINSSGLVTGIGGLAAGNLDPQNIGTGELVDSRVVIGWNATSGGGEVDFFNVATSTTLNGGFNFYQTTPGVIPANPVVRIDRNGYISAKSMTLTASGGGEITFQDGTTQSTAASAPSGSANEVYATPNGSSGAASLRSLVPTDLPVATTSALGAVKPDGTSITISGGVLSATGSSQHLVSTGPTPTIAVGSAGGSGSASISGNDSAGNIILNSGSGAGSGPLVTVTFATPFASANIAIIAMPSNGSTAALGAFSTVPVVSGSVDGFSIVTHNTASSGQTYGWSYVVIGCS